MKKLPPAQAELLNRIALDPLQAIADARKFIALDALEARGLITQRQSGWNRFAEITEAGRSHPQCLSPSRRPLAPARTANYGGRLQSWGAETLQPAIG